MQKLIADPVCTVLIKDPDPGAHRPLYRGKTDQVMILDHLEQGKECLRTAGIHGLTDRLPGPLLEPGRQKKIPQHLIKPGISAHDDAADHFVAQHCRIIFSVQDLPNCTDRLLPSQVDLGRQYPGIGPAFRPGMVIDLRIRLPRQDLCQTGLIKFKLGIRP